MPEEKNYTREEVIELMTSVLAQFLTFKQIAEDGKKIDKWIDENVK